MTEGFSHPINLHFSGSGKLWTYMRDKAEYWWYYANKTGYLKEIIIYTNYNKNMVDRMFTLLEHHHEYIFNYKI